MTPNMFVPIMNLKKNKMDKTTQDLAWSILPKEFKEEVKEYYDNSPVLGVNAVLLLENLFGIHNLTSDAEREEMLTVPRSKVQYRFQYAKEGVEENSNYYNGYAQAIYDLFGSKCLPDELNEDNFASKKPKPAEPKYHVGDIVRFKYCCTPYRIDGFKMLDGAMLYQVGEVWAEASDLEPYTEPKKEEPERLQAKSVETLRIASKESHLRNLSQETANCDEEFDNILKDSFSKERRLNIAVQITQSILHNSDEMLRAETCSNAKQTPNAIAEYAFAITDALIAESEKGDSK